MSQKQARAQRQKAEAAPLERQAIRLDAARAAGSRITAYLQGTLQKVLESQEVENIVAGYLDGKDLQDRWGIQLRGFQVGEIWLVPQVKQPEPQRDPSDVPSAGQARKDSA